MTGPEGCAASFVSLRFALLGGTATNALLTKADDLLFTSCTRLHDMRFRRMIRSALRLIALHLGFVELGHRGSR